MYCDEHDAGLVLHGKMERMGLWSWSVMILSLVVHVKCSILLVSACQDELRSVILFLSLYFGEKRYIWLLSAFGPVYHSIVFSYILRNVV